MRRTKIICTLGPATDDKKVLKALMSEGMNVARLNFSHGTQEEQGKRIDAIKECREALSLPVGILLDTRGPEIRLKTFKEGKISLEAGAKFTLTTNDIEGDASICAVTFENLPKNVEIGTKILIDDGLLGLEVLEITETDVVCAVLNSGDLSNRKSINIPGVHIDMPYINDKDHADIIFGIKNGIDFVAASFARTKEDVKELRALLNDNGGSDIEIIAKIENREGVENASDILKYCEEIGRAHV